MKVYAISDITFDHIAKEADSITDGAISLVVSYEEDIITKLLAMDVSELKDVDLIYVHSDQLFHRRPVEWQKMFCNALVQFSAQVKDKKILVSNSLSNSFKTPPLKSSFGNSFDTAFLYSQEAHQLLLQPNVFVFDLNAICTQIGEQNFYNYATGHLYQMPYTLKGVRAIGQSLVAYCKWLFTEEKKVIVVDCDNTLWKGVIGEDGLNGIYSDKDAEGIVYYHFQEFLKIKKEEGFLLCICSKNNEKDVKEAFDHKSFVLKWDDFIVRKINWADKAANIKEMATELNLGVDSFIFIDDSKFELDLVGTLLKNITCIEFTNDYTNFLDIASRFEFKKSRVLKEDLEKTEQYVTQQQRDAEQQQYGNIDDFIKGLQIKMDVRLNDAEDLERLSQMTGKTNQFNFNKEPYTAEQLTEFIDKGGKVYSLKVSDKFGDYGTVGMIMFLPGKNKNVILENYLMSCRALGKKIEDNFLQYVVDDLTKNELKITSVKFVKTVKNIPAEKFYNRIKNETNYFRTATSIS